MFADVKAAEGDGNIACSECKLLPTKPVEIIRTEGAKNGSDRFLKRVLLIRAERVSNGGIVDKSSVTGAEYQSLIYYDMRFDEAKTVSATKTRLDLSETLDILKAMVTPKA